MLLEFKVKNFRSIKDWQSFSMLSENKVNELSDSLIRHNDLEILSSAIIYGRNASGKSNMLKAFSSFRYLVTRSSDFKVDKKISSYKPYKLDNLSQNLPTEFYIDFISDDKLRYVYEIGFDADKIIYEKLKFYPKSQSAILFDRKSGRKIKYGDYLKGKKKEIEEKLYDNQLFLSKVGSEKLESLTSAYLFFSTYLFTSTLHDTKYDDLLIRIFTNKIAEDNIPYFKENINKLMKVADTGIDCIDIKEDKIEVDDLPKDMSAKEKEELVEKYKYKIRTIHKKFDGDKIIGEERFRLNEESTGTIKLLAIGGLILDALSDGSVLIIDELDKSLHPKLTRTLVNIFQSRKTNPKKAQLIFATHDVSLLDSELFRRDQVWFAEKEYEGWSHYYAISDVAGVRANSPFEKYYMSGRFGATPVINENELIFQFED